LIELISVLVMTHITIICVTVYLHRGQAHRGITFHPVLEHFLRFWLWITTGMLTKEWVAVHRLHHRKCETPEDPHSPVTKGIWRVLFGGAWLYVKAKQDRKMVEQYGVGTPDDWMERNVYTRYPKLGFLSLLAIEIVLFGWVGLLMWGIQMIWIPWWAAGVINGLGHWWGYRNAETNDNSKNIVPWGIIVGGEELHANHHLNPASPKLSLKSWEFDIGWMYIRVLEILGLARVKRV
jgi:stearoyl-CoA desaturase (delta-9 desaturase)